MWIPVSARNYGSTEKQWAAGPSIGHEKFSEDHETLEIKITTLSGETRTLWRDHDSAWISPADGAMDVTSPDGKWAAFISDRSGWPHLYVIPIDATSESQARQLSKGAFGDGYAAWSPDGKQVASTHSAEGNQMERFISIASPATGRTEPIVSGRSVNRAPAFSPDGSMLIYGAQSNILLRFIRSRRSPALWLLGLPTPFRPDCFHRISSRQPQFTIRAGPTQNQFQLRSWWTRIWIAPRSIRPSSGFMALAPIKTIWLGTPAFTACTTQ
jgi:hypothetical protein